jgi:hypothetical protein
MKNRYLQVIIPLSLALTFVAVMILFFPFRYRFEFDHDEGVNLIKAMMTIKGYSLYSQIWSDQPPIFNAVLTPWLSLIGIKVNAGRLLVLGFSAVLLASATHYLHRFWGVPHAILGMIAIITLPYYAQLSVSVMIGLPSIAFAMLSFVGITHWHQDKKDSWLIFSSLFLALSMMTKLWTAILIPIFIAGIFIDRSDLLRGKLNVRDSVRPIFIWSSVFILVAGAIILFMIRPGNISQVIGVHLAASETETMQNIAAQNSVNSYLDDSMIIFILSLFGAAIAIHSKTWHSIYLVAWMLVAYGLFTWIITPFWSHHQLLITLPAALLGSIAMGYSLVDLVKRLLGSKLINPGIIPSAVILLLTLFFGYQRFPAAFDEFRTDLPNFRTCYDPKDDVDYKVVATIRKYADGTNYLFTDRPIFAFRAGIPVHPYLAVMTKKRYAIEQPTQEELLSILIEFKPEQIILDRFEYPAAQEYMKPRNFRRVNPLLPPLHYMKREIYEGS